MGLSIKPVKQPSRSGPTLGQLLMRTESGQRDPYRALFGHSQRPGGRFEGVDPTQMTIADLLRFQSPSGEYGQWVKGQVGRVATPVGGYQIVGTTLRNAVEELGIDPNTTKFDPGTQSEIAAHLARRRLRPGMSPAQKRAALRAEWEGFGHVRDDELDAAIAAFEEDPSTFYVDPENFDNPGTIGPTRRNALAKFGEVAGATADGANENMTQLGEEAEQSEHYAWSQLVPEFMNIPDPMQGQAQSPRPQPRPTTPQPEAPPELDATMSATTQPEGEPEGMNPDERRQWWADTLSGMGVAFGNLAAGGSFDMVSPIQQIQQQRQQAAMAQVEQERQVRMDQLAERRVNLDARRVAAEERRLELSEAQQNAPMSFPTDYAERTLSDFPQTQPFFDMWSEGIASGNKSMVDAGMKGVSDVLGQQREANNAQALPQDWISNYAVAEDNVERARLFDQLSPDQQAVATELVGQPIQEGPDTGVLPSAARGAEWMKEQAALEGEDISYDEALRRWREAEPEAVNPLQTLLEMQREEAAAAEAKARGAAVQQEYEALTQKGVSAHRNLRSLNTVRDAAIEFGTMIEGEGAGAITERIARIAGSVFDENAANSVYRAMGFDDASIDALGQEAKAMGFLLAEKYGISGQGFSDRDQQIIQSLTPGALNTQTGRVEFLTSLQANNLLDRASADYISDVEGTEERQRAISMLNNRVNAAHAPLAEYYEFAIESSYDNEMGARYRAQRDIVADIAGDPEREAALADLLRERDPNISTNADAYVQDIIRRTFPSMTSEVAEVLLPHLMGEPTFVGYYDVDTGEYVRKSDLIGEAQ